MSKVHIHLNYHDFPEPEKLQELMTLVDATYHIHIEGKRHWWYPVQRDLAIAIGQVDEFEARYDQMTQEHDEARKQSKNLQHPYTQAEPEADPA